MVGVRFPSGCNWTQCRQRFATAATFLRSCGAQVLSRGDEPHHSLLASAKYRKCNKELIFKFFVLQKILIDNVIFCRLLTSDFDPGSRTNTGFRVDFES